MAEKGSEAGAPPQTPLTDADLTELRRTARAAASIAPDIQIRVADLADLLDEIGRLDALLAEARREIAWWAKEHRCCRGHEGDLLARLETARSK
jgi:predicted signal transduction protein with EAL and GGDEF domain